MNPRPCIIGLDEPQNDELKRRMTERALFHETLPKMFVRDGELFVESSSGYGVVPVSRVVFHGIFEDDHDFIAGLALWGGPCLPNAQAMIDCRLSCHVWCVPFDSPPMANRRTAISLGLEYPTTVEWVAKWGIGTAARTKNDSRRRGFLRSPQNALQELTRSWADRPACLTTELVGRRDGKSVYQAMVLLISFQRGIALGIQNVGHQTRRSGDSEHYVAQSAP